MTNGAFVITRGNGKTIDYEDAFPASNAKQIAYDILGIANKYKKANSQNAKLRNQINDTDISGKKAEKIIKEVIKQSPETEKTKDIKKILKGEKVDQGEEIVMLEHAEKSNQEVIYKTYQVFGDRWFTGKDFKRFYNKRWDKTEPASMLAHLHNIGRINKDKLPEEEREGRMKYRYRVSKTARKSIEEGRLMSDDNPGWRFKKKKLPKDARPQIA